MDKTPEYIKMCEMATKIQEIKRKNMKPIGVKSGSKFEQVKRDYHNFFLMSSKEDVYSCPHNNYEIYYGNDCPFADDIWLPRQDQLQGMVKSLCGIMPKYQTHPSVFGGFIDYCIDLSTAYKEYVFKADTLEQLWLMYLMKNNYNKVWNGKDWVE